jgi:hypothetical protein
MKKKVIERDCVDCNEKIPYMQNRIRCLSCYKLKKTMEENKKIQFIEDD